MEADDLKDNLRFGSGTPITVRKHIEANADSWHRYCSYLQFIDDELVIRTWAYRRSRDELMYTEVERKSPACEMAVRQNIYLTAMSGYKPVYKPQTHCNGNWYGYTYYYFDGSDFNKWYRDKPMGLYTKLLNVESLYENSKYKYCGYSGAGDLCEYLKAYDKDPFVEYFGKLKIKPSATLMKKCKKDKQFISFLLKNADKVRVYGPKITIFAYDKRKTFEEAEDFLQKKLEAERLTARMERITEVDRIRIAEYMQRPEVGKANYRDYWKAITYLGFDLTDTKNLFPNDFKRMHDLRIDEYHSKLAKEDEEKKREICKKFYQVSMAYKAIEVKGDMYSLLIPIKPAELVREGKMLDHCVGRMGYDQKVADGRSLIAFVRLSSDIRKPYVTVEYDLKTYKMLQCYAKHDSRPPEEVIDFARSFCEIIKKEGKKHERRKVLACG